MRVLGVDLAWGESAPKRRANETGVVAVDAEGRILDAGWTVGVDQTLAWIASSSGSNALAMIDAPLVVDNDDGQRLCEKQVGQRYGRWKVAANSTNLGSPRLAGREVLRRLETMGWHYNSGSSGPPLSGRHISECYPYTCIVGAFELGYDTERPLYKRKPKGMRIAEFRVARARTCDELIERLAGLSQATTPLNLRSHPNTADLVERPSPLEDAAYKHREDLIDAVICAWTGLLWIKNGFDRVQVLGDLTVSKAATIVSPARKSQRTSHVSDAYVTSTPSILAVGGAQPMEVKKQ